MNSPKKINIESTFEVYISEKDLAREDRSLIERAREAAKLAHAPYSKFYVGAAVLLETGIIVTGNNQENMASPSGMCAERIAAFNASAQFPGIKMKSIAIAYHSDTNPFTDTITPCGACRQVLAEYELRADVPIRIVMASMSGKVCIAPSIKSLLPLMFDKKYLK